MPRIGAEWIGLIRFDFWPLFIKQDIKRFSDWFGMARNSSIQKNACHYEICFRIIPKLLWTSPKNVLNLIRCKTIKGQSYSLRFNSRLQSKWFQTKFSIRNNLNQSKVGIIRIENSFEWIRTRINSDQSLVLNRMIQNDSETDYGMAQNSPDPFGILHRLWVTSYQIINQKKLLDWK